MSKPSYYPPANCAQWFAGKYPGATFSHLDKMVWHTTEGNGWPAYQGGAVAPTLTAFPDMNAQKVYWRQHFPLLMSARALKNTPGGVETNTDHAVQVELIGTCDPHGVGMFWPDAPDWALEALADFARFLHDEHGIPYQAPALWLPYPASAGGTRARMSGSTWNSFRGHCGHQHVPENDHGDPGRLNIKRIFSLAQGADMPLTAADADLVVDHLLSRVLTTGWHGTGEYDPNPANAEKHAVGEILATIRGNVLAISNGKALPLAQEITAAIVAALPVSGNLTEAEVETAVTNALAKLRIVSS